MTIEFAPGPYPAYAWSFPLADGRANVGYGVFDRRGSGNRQAYLDALRTLLPGQEPEPSTVRGHHLPLSTGPRFHPDGRVLLAGDAAATVNPLTGEGIFDAVAFGSAGRAGGAAGRRRGCRAPGRDAPQLRAAPPAQRRDGPAHRPPGFLDAAVSAASAHRSVFDAAVRLGLERGTVPPAALALILAHLVADAAGAARLTGPGRPGGQQQGDREPGHDQHRAERGRDPGRRPARNPSRQDQHGQHRHRHRERRRHRRAGGQHHAWPRAAAAAAAPRLARPPSRCGRPRTPVAASSSRSGSTLAKWAPAPSSAPAIGSHHGGVGAAGQREHDEHRQQAEADEVGQHGEPARLQPEVIGPTRGHRNQVRGAGRDTAGERQRHAGGHGQRRSRPPTVRADTVPAAIGLSDRPTARSRSASSRSFSQPMESWPVRTARPISTTRPTSCPAVAARAVIMRVTAAVGSGWQRAQQSGRHRADAPHGRRV